MTDKKICANKLCRQEFTPTPCRTPHRQKYCPACVRLSATVRRRTEPPQTKQCDNPMCDVTFTKRCAQQRYCSAICRLEHEKSKMCRHNGSSVIAICPRCGKKHLAGVEWTGKGTPFLFCVSCNVYRCGDTFAGVMLDHVGQCCLS